MTHFMEPLLLCPDNRCGKTATPPDSDITGPAALLECPDCHEPMMLVVYAVLEHQARLSAMYRAVKMAGELRRV